MKKNAPAPQEIPIKDAPGGLTSDEVALRAENNLQNGLTQSAARSEREIILENTLTFFNLVFVVLAAIVALSGSSVKNMAFLIVVICNTVIGCYQEIRAKRAVDRLTLVAAQTLPTLRDGELATVRSDLLVRDDVVEYTAGNQICADGVLCNGELQVNEGLITGEEDAVLKRVGDEVKSGSFVVAGTARVRLTKVGKDSFAAQLALEAKRNPHAAKSEMMKSLDRLIRVVGIGLVPVGLLLFYQEYFVLSLGLQKSVEGTVSALVGMIPEGLYLLTSIAVAASSLKLARQKVLVQDMNCMETLARVDVLCVDKTGTITQPGMQVEEVVPLTDAPPEELEQTLCAFYSNMQGENDTAAAMQELFSGETDWVCTKRVPFQSDTKWSGATFAGKGSFLVGAPEYIMGSRYGEIRASVETGACRGYRVLLVAGYDGPIEGLLQENGLRPLALVLLSNRIRENAPQTFDYFEKQGVTIKVISGDSPLTVSEVARRADIQNAEHWVDVTELENPEAFACAVKQYTVFGRVTPDKKRQLIRALKEQGHTVAMTGDGVNDVLAMKEADCSVAMASGAQAASQIAQLVLLNSDFAAMPHIVGEGRRVINNIQRAATLFLVKNIFSVGLALITLFTGMPYPIVPLHLSLVSALTIGIPSFFLAMEPNYQRVQGHFLRGVLRKAFPGGLTNICVVLMAQGFMTVFALPLPQISTVCAALLGVVGLLVLFQTSKPFDFFRAAVWTAMAVAMLFSFTVLAQFFQLTPGSRESGLILLALLFMTPTVFMLVLRLFDLGTLLVRKLFSRK